MKSVKLQNLHCANCALKIEKKLNELEELNNVTQLSHIDSSK